MERKLAAIFSTDVQGYSRLMGENEEATIRTLTAYREVMTRLIQQHRGRVVDSPGDNLLAEFASAVDAVQAAIEIQQELKARNTALPPSRQMHYRIGINVGDVVVEGERIYGDGVNIAARLEALAEGGGICIAGTVYDQVENKLSLGYEYVGEQMVKNIAKPVRVYRVRLEAKALATEPGKDKGTSPLPTSALPLPDKPSIIILPFVNLSNDPEQEYFSDGITEDITTDLSKISSLFVISRNSAFTYKGKAMKVQDISREMGVRYVLEGSVRRANDRVRVTAQLIEATTDHHLWAERYDRLLTDIFALQDEIRQKIMTALKVKLTPEEQERFQHAPTNNLEAYDYYLRGLESFLRAQNETKKEANAQARQMYEKALEVDPQYAGAYAGLGWSYWFDWFYQWNPDRAQSLERAFELTQRAITLNDSLSQAHALLGYVHLFKRQYEQAIAEAERAVVVAPGDARGCAVLGVILAYAGRSEEGIGLIEKAVRLNPCYPVYLGNLGWVYRVVGRYEEALAPLKKALIFAPNFQSFHFNLAACYAELGRLEEARAEMAEALRFNPAYSLEAMRQTLPYKDPVDLECYLAGLRKAGLK